MVLLSKNTGKASLQGGTNIPGNEGGAVIQGAREVPVVQGTTSAALVIQGAKRLQETLEIEMVLEIHGTLEIQVTQVTQGQED